MIDNLKITSQYPFCPYALSMDLYWGCPHGCTYCFAQQAFYANNSMNERSFTTERPMTLKGLQNFLEGSKRDGGKKGNSNFLQHFFKIRQPLHVGGMYDPFPRGWEEQSEVGKHFLELMNAHQYPAIISTKNPPTQYADLFKAGKYVLQVSTPLNAVQAQKVERGALPLQERLEAIKSLKHSVQKIVARVQPYIIGTFTEDEFKEHVKTLKQAGVDAITMEFLKFSVFNSEGVRQQRTLLSQQINRDVNKDLTEIEGSDNVYPLSERIRILRKARDSVHEAGMEFYSAENALRDLGDGWACCGINQENSAETDFHSKLRYTTNEALFKAKQNGVVTLKEMIDNQSNKDLFEHYKIVYIRNTQNRKWRLQHATLTFKQLLENNWNTKNATNPAVFFKNLRPAIKDGAIAYEYVGEKSEPTPK